MFDQLRPGGYLVIGTHERVPDHDLGLEPLTGSPQIFRRAAA